MTDEQQLIERCLENNIRAQEELYKQYSRKMYGLCLRYAKNRPDADDILQESFIKIFFNLKNYKGAGSFEGWIRRTITTTAINHYKKFLRESRQLDVEEIVETEIMEESIDDELGVEDLIGLLREIPDIQRLVFNLFVMEGYSHREIGQMLDIPENTSKSHMARAKRNLQYKIMELQKISIIN
jgi:RNA polymerase sigma factor (sigma-70 family)